MFKNFRLMVATAVLSALSVWAGFSPTATAGPVGIVQTVNTQPGGTQSLLNVTAAVVVKATPGTLMRIIPETVGTAGSLVINDNTATGGSNVAANQINSIPFGSMTAGVPVILEVPCKNGIVISAVPTGFVGSVFFF